MGQLMVVIWLLPAALGQVTEPSASQSVMPLTSTLLVEGLLIVPEKLTFTESDDPPVTAVVQLLETPRPAVGETKHWPVRTPFVSGHAFGPSLTATGPPGVAAASTLASLTALLLLAGKSKLPLYVAVSFGSRQRTVVLPLVQLSGSTG